MLLALNARLRDGTLIEVPDDGPLPELDLKPALQSNRKVTIYLGVPLLKSSQPNVAPDGPADNTRYYLITQQLEDENLGGNPQPIPIRRLNLKLLLSTQNLAGYETVPIARIENSERADATPQLDANYFPPVVACDAWHDLGVGILQSIYDRIGRKIEKLAGQAVSRGLSVHSTAPGDVLIFAQLRELNEAYATLTNVAFLEGIHPLVAYQELCRLVGQLAVFSLARRTPAIPRYNHDDLGGCFYQLKNYFDDLLSIVPEPDYQERPFVGRGLRMQVEIEPAWLDQNATMYIGVTSPLEPDRCTWELERLGAKVSDVGLQFTQVPLASLPQALPRDAGPSVFLTYLQINREQQKKEWQSVESTRTLAILFRKETIVGRIEDAHEVTLRLASDITFRFTLYVLGGGASCAEPGIAEHMPKEILLRPPSLLERLWRVARRLAYKRVRALAAPETVSPPVLRRHTDVSFPARVQLGKRYNLRVLLVPAEEELPGGEIRERPKPHAHDATMNLGVSPPPRQGAPAPPIRVSVSVAAENFEIDGPDRAELDVPMVGASPAVQFGLLGLKVGPGRVMIDFAQDNRPAGSVDLSSEIVADTKADRILCGPAPAVGALNLRLDLELNPAPPDLVLKVFEHRLAGHPGRLHFVLSSTHRALSDLPVLDGDLAWIPTGGKTD